MSTINFAIDFDSANTNIYRMGSGLVLSEPTVAAVDAENGEVKAIGIEASRLIGKTNKDTKIVFPVFEGEIVNDKVATTILEGFMKKAELDGGLALFSVPCGVTAEMIEKIKKVAKNAGVSKMVFVEAPILSAIGQRALVSDSTPCFVIDMAGGITNIAALTLEGVIAGVSVNLGANKINADIIDFLTENYGLQVGLQTAEKLRKEVGSLDIRDELSTVVNGRDVKTGSPKAVGVRAMDILEPIQKFYDKIGEIAMNIVRKLPPEVSAEIRNSGINISGLASSVYCLKEYYEKKFDIKVNVADSGMMSIVLGGGIVLGNNELLKKVKLDI